MICAHVTTTDRVTSILSRGLFAPSYWTIDERILSYHMLTQSANGRTPAIIVTSLHLIDEADLRPDMPAIENPIAAAFGSSERDIENRWFQATRRDWRDSLRIVRSLAIIKVVPRTSLHQSTSYDLLFQRLATQAQTPDRILW